MATFESSPQVSSFPNQNILYNSAAGITAQGLRTNELLNQGRQMDLTAADHEQVSRLSAALLNEQDLAKRGDLYARGVGMLQSQGLAKYAPATLPDESTLRMLAAQGTPSADLYKQQLGAKALDAVYPGPSASTAPGGGTTAPPGAAPSGAGTATIGQRQNNPGNLTFAGQPGASPGQGNRFASFPDMPTGVAATANQLALYQEQHGINTVRGAVTRWVSDPKADLTSYTADVAKALGVGPDDPIDLTNPDVQAKFIQAQFPHESAGGGYVLNPADVAKGVQMATANRGRTVQAPGTASAPGRVQVASATPTAATDGTTAAPVPPTAVAQPTSATTAPPPPAATTAPAQAPLPPDQLTLQDHVELARFKAALAASGRPDAPVLLQAEIDRRRTANVAAQHQTMEEQRQTTQDRAAQDKATREAAHQARLDAAGGDPARATLLEIAPSIIDGTATDAMRRIYELNYQATTKGQLVPVPDPSGEPGKVIFVQAPGSIPSYLPPPDYRPKQNAAPGDQSTSTWTPGQKPPPLEKPASPMTQDQATAATYADRMAHAEDVMGPLESAAQSWSERSKQKFGDFIGYSINSPDYQKVRQAQDDWIYAKLRKESGAQINPTEFENDRRAFFPQAGETSQVAEQKRQAREIAMAGLVREAGAQYKPPARADAIVSVKTPDEATALKPGTKYVTPDGHRYIR